MRICGLCFAKVWDAIVVINCDFAMVVAVIDENDLLDDMKRLNSYFLAYLIECFQLIIL